MNLSTWFSALFGDFQICPKFGITWSFKKFWCLYSVPGVGDFTGLGCGLSTGNFGRSPDDFTKRYNLLCVHQQCMSVLVAHTLASACRVHSVLLRVQWCLTAQSKNFGVSHPQSLMMQTLCGTRITGKCWTYLCNEWGNREDGAKKHDAFPSDTQNKF